MKSSMYHQIRDLVVELHIYIFHTKLSLVIEVVLDTRLIITCNSADDSVPLVMSMVMLIPLTHTQLNCSAIQNDPR
jgi:hypothetical protein